jgi:hypothetical protein
MKLIHITAKKNITHDKIACNVSVPELYSIACSLNSENYVLIDKGDGAIHTGYTEEHVPYLFVCQADQSATAVLSTGTCHRIKFHDFEVLFRNFSYKCQLFKGACKQFLQRR